MHARTQTHMHTTKINPMQFSRVIEQFHLVFEQTQHQNVTSLLLPPQEEAHFGDLLGLLSYLSKKTSKPLGITSTGQPVHLDSFLAGMVDKFRFKWKTQGQSYNINCTEVVIATIYLQLYILSVSQHFVNSTILRSIKDYNNENTLQKEKRKRKKKRGRERERQKKERITWHFFC